MGARLKVCQLCRKRKRIGRTKKQCKSCRKVSVVNGVEYVLTPSGFNYRTDYLTSEWWKERKRRKIVSVGCQCEQCGTKSVALHVHHLSYANLWGEPDEDLQVLCEPCHKTKHPGWE